MADPEFLKVEAPSQTGVNLLFVEIPEHFREYLFFLKYETEDFPLGLTLFAYVCLKYFESMVWYTVQQNSKRRSIVTCDALCGRLSSPVNVFAKDLCE